MKTTTTKTANQHPRTPDQPSKGRTAVQEWGIREWVRVNRANRTPDQIRRANRTGRKSLDRLAADPRIACADDPHVRGEAVIWSEGEDGYWATLAEGVNWEGCRCIHEYTIRDLYTALSMVEVGPTY